VADRLAKYRNFVRRREADLSEMLAKGVASAGQIAIFRLLVLGLQEMLKRSPAEVAGYDLLAKGGMPPELLWERAVYEIVERRLYPELRDPNGFRRLHLAYLDLALELQDNVRKSAEYMSQMSREILIVRHNPVTKQVIDDIGHELLRYRDRHQHDDNFLTTPPKVALAKLLLVERKDLNLALRAALDLGGDVTSIKLPERDRPWYVDAVEFAVAVIPVVGSAVSAWEAYSGKNLFGYKLSDVERGILAGSVLLPMAGRLVREGRALYTANRMAAMYGGDAFKWSYSLAMGERLSADAVGLARWKSAQQVVREGAQVTKQVAETITTTLKSIGIDAAEKALPFAIESKLVKAFAAVVKKFPILKGLDELAIERVAAKKLPEHAKGQLMEELMESRITAWLQDPLGRRALGLEQIKDPLEFIPGHLIRDGDGLLLTDGMIVSRSDDTLVVVAVFEAKAGKASSRGLARKYKGRKAMSDADLAELEAEAREALRELKERARLSGGKVTKTLEQLKKEIKLTEVGGQIRADVERLSEMPVFINSVEVKLKVGPRSTRWFGVLPKDVKGDFLRQAIKDAGIPNVEILGLDITQKQLKDAVDLLGKALAPAK